ncbi:MAG TPA: hypothetical protein ENN17_12440 [bacterium]|nr:hypothetical protein [bacterium]
MNRTQTKTWLLLMAFSLPVAAQTSNDMPFTKDSRAVQFQIGGDFTLGSFQGAAFSYKHHRQPSAAYRAGIYIYLNDTNTEMNQWTPGIRKTTDDQVFLNAELNVQAVWYAENTRGVLFYYGTGPFLGFGRYREKNKVIAPLIACPQSESTADRERTSWSLGLTGLAGVEWFVSKSISLHAEYGISLGYSSMKEETETANPGTGSRSNSDVTSTSWQLRSQGVRFGLSVYFR